ncbi:MAG: PhoH family protein [Holdemanella sp.]|nr:PhoH family protein [Holdemanella sp.]
MAYRTVDLSSYTYEEIQAFAGFQDCHIDILEKTFKTKIIIRSQELKFEECEQSDALEEVVNRMFDILGEQGDIHNQDVSYLCHLACRHKLSAFEIKQLSSIGKTKSGKMIYPKTVGQARLCDAFRKNDIVFATGVAGTGKTYLAVCYAVSVLKSEKIQKIVLTRPAVEAGESLGFLPGDMKEKVDPYLRPLYDALYEMLGVETVEKLLEKQVIEIAPLAFMRGRTLNDAIVILDEAQNTTQAQMKMFLTRMGKNTQMIINGDVTQIDLIKKHDSGLMQACSILEDIKGIEIVHLKTSDVVRNPLVQKIIERYATIEK